LKIALDTNVLISAYISRGLSADVFRYVLVDHDLILSEQVLSEFSRILESKFGVPKKHVTEFVRELRQHQVEPLPVEKIEFEMVRDPDDRIVLQSAINGGATIIVTGDRDLLDVSGKITQIKIQNPRQFWESIRTGK
jgi:putative PIN family toxin of toxin-antitoxin system